MERVLTFSADECHFGYRNSIFKTEYKNRLLITHVYFRLSKPPHVLITKYRNVAEKIDDLPEKTIASMRDLIIRIREAKLPDYRVLGNAGSFFKNPIIHAVVADRLRASFPDVPLYPDLNKMLKVSAAWLIEKSGCKSLRMGNAATHTQQPLVLVNLGSATGKEILALSAHIQKTVKEKFGILLVPEVNIY